jgi:hypothetical protein
MRFGGVGGGGGSARVERQGDVVQNATSCNVHESLHLYLLSLSALVFPVARAGVICAGGGGTREETSGGTHNQLSLEKLALIQLELGTPLPPVSFLHAPIRRAETHKTSDTVGHVTPCHDQNHPWPRHKCHPLFGVKRSRQPPEPDQPALNFDPVVLRGQATAQSPPAHGLLTSLLGE